MSGPDGLEGASRDELLRQLRTCRTAMLHLSREVAALRERVSDLDAAVAGRVVRAEPMTQSELIGLAYFGAPDHSDEERILEDALDRAAEREGVDLNEILVSLVGSFALLAEQGGAS